MQESAQLSIFKGYADFTSKLEMGVKSYFLTFCYYPLFLQDIIFFTSLPPKYVKIYNIDSKKGISKINE